MLSVLDLFSGIGGFSLGLERTGGFQTVAFCEIDHFCRRVLQKHWPNVRQYEDVRELTADKLATDGIAVDVITGGFPCQDISVAGKQAGIAEGTRSGLWSEIVRLARELRPRFIIVENVSNLLAGPSDRPGGWFGRVLGDLAEIGYDSEWHCIPASAVGLPHRRDRVWIVAHNRRERGEGQFFQALQGLYALPWGENERRAADFMQRPDIYKPRLCGAGNGLSERVDALGNAVVPQIPEIIGKAILESFNLLQGKEHA